VKSYWDLTEQERAVLSDEDFKKYLTVELMEKGVVAVQPLVLKDVPEVKIPTKPYWVVKGDRTSQVVAVFEKKEDAEKLLSLTIYAQDYEWHDRARRHYAKPLGQLVLSCEEMSTEADVLNAKNLLAEAYKVEKENDEARVRYQKECKAIDEVTSSLYEDRMERQDRLLQMQRIYKTQQEYLQLCEGNVELANTFLLKAYPAEDVNELASWLPYLS